MPLTRLTSETDGPCTSLATGFWSGYKVSGKQDLRQVSNDLSNSFVLHPCGLFLEAFIYVHNGCWGLHSRETSACHIYELGLHTSFLHTEIPNFHNCFLTLKVQREWRNCVFCFMWPSFGNPSRSLDARIWGSMGVDVKQWGYPPRLQSGWKIDYFMFIEVAFVQS